MYTASVKSTPMAVISIAVCLVMFYRASHTGGKQVNKETEGDSEPILPPELAVW